MSRNQEVQVASDTLRRPVQCAGVDLDIVSAVTIPTPAAARPAGSTGRAGSAGVIVEVLHLRADRAGQWHYRRTAEGLPAHTDPDRAARRIAGLDNVSSPHVVLHSTSWRYDPSGHVILTYAVLPDPDPTAPAKPLPSMEIARGQHHAHPAPAAVRPAHVAAHAIRHLAWLAGTDPIVAAAFSDDEVLCAALADARPGPAGRLS